MKNTKKTSKTNQANVEMVQDQPTSQLHNRYVYMDKAISLLEIGYKVQKNVILFGPGGHGKSELTIDFFAEKGITPYVITMGNGMTTDRLFGGIDIPTVEQTGKIEYLIENSFMAHEYVIFEELFDSPDYILEQLKDILSSKKFRNGSQVYDIKTKFIVCNTNRTRDEFAKNMSLKALMERFPLETKVEWDTYNEITYSTLLFQKFGKENVDPILPYLLEEYAKQNIVISPRVAINSVEIYNEANLDGLFFISEFNKKPEILRKAVKQFESTIKFKELKDVLIQEIEAASKLTINNADETKIFSERVEALKQTLNEFKKLTVADSMIEKFKQIVDTVKVAIETLEKKSSIVNVMMKDSE